MSIIAIRVLNAGPGQVSLLTSVGLAAGALLAIPLGPWVEFRRKRPVMITMDLIRFGAQATVPVAYLLGWLSFVQLLLVTIVVAGAKIAFQSASGAHLTALVKQEDLLVASARFESTTWSSLVVGPPLGGAAIGLFGTVTSIGVFNPLLATHRLQQTAPVRLARTLSAWSVSTSAATALLTALWGLLAELIGLGAAIATAGILALPTPLLLPRPARKSGAAEPVAPVAHTA